MSYDRKDECLDSLVSLLQESTHDIQWGWGKDSGGYIKDVLYVDLPNGQVSFHASNRKPGPGYRGEWDITQNSEENVLEFCEDVLVSIEEGPPLKKPAKPKKQFICDECDAKKMSSQPRPPKWRNVWVLGDSYMVCSTEREGVLRRRKLDETLTDEYVLEEGEHKCSKPSEVPIDYSEWIVDNVESRRSSLLDIARYEVQRRRST